jgi:hypothetical protein
MRDQGHTTKTQDIIGRQNNDYIEGSKMSGDRAAAPVLPLDIILPHLELFCSSGQLGKFLQGTRIVDDFDLDASRLHS